MNKEVVRTQFLRDKEFLRNLYESNGNVALVKEKLNYASDAELNTLLKFLHFLSKGDIRIKKLNFDAIIQSRKLLLIKRTVEKPKSIKQILTAERQAKIKFLRQLGAIYHNLLYALFNE